jgi:hypothetical protein
MTPFEEIKWPLDDDIMFLAILGFALIILGLYADGLLGGITSTPASEWCKPVGQIMRCFAS